MKAKIESVKVKYQTDTDPDTSFIGKYTDNPSEWAIIRIGEHAGKYGLQDWNRMESLERGDWNFIGITAEAKCLIPTDNAGTYRIQKFTSGGLWGIESDSDKDYLASVVKEQIADLKQYLKQFGIPIRQFDKLAKEAADNPVYE